MLLPGSYERIDTVGQRRRVLGLNAGALVSTMWDRGRVIATPDGSVPALQERARRDFALFVDPPLTAADFGH